MNLEEVGCEVTDRIVWLRVGTCSRATSRAVMYLEVS
jgi:hypothetical protein